MSTDAPPGPKADNAAGGAAVRVVVANVSDGGVLYWLLRFYVFAACALVALTIGGSAIGIRHLTRNVPPIPDFTKYARTAAAATRIVAADGTLIGEFSQEWREIVPLAEVPLPLQQAVIAIEDHRFYEHGGLYVKGILRAIAANLTARDFSQGGSTITQQVAKQFLGSEKSILRKAKEAIWARQLEARYSKKTILSVYLNHIYFGAGAWGVGAAAKRYFQKSLAELSLGEMALLAGLPQAPNKYSPLRDTKRALARRAQVLAAMARYGYITKEQALAAENEPLALRPFRDVFGDKLPYYGEHLRRHVVDTYGEEALMKGGLRVEAAAEPVFEAEAYDTAEFGARRQDKRQGWRGPEAKLTPAATKEFVGRQTALYGEGELELGRRYLALVESVAPSVAQLRIGPRVVTLPLRNMAWAAKWSEREAVNDRVISSVASALRVGDVVWVQRETHQRGKYREWHVPDGSNPQWKPAQDEAAWDAANANVVTLEQPPYPQTAIFSADHQTGYVAAMVGGSDFSRSVFNRAYQACRQPGSTYKPIYYSLAMEEGYGFDTMLNDVPVAQVDPVTGEVWIPLNLHGTIDHEVTLEYALVFSKNIPSVDIFSKLGAKEVEAWARKLGFTSEIIADKALALGASCTYLHEMVHAFALFARNGRALKWVFARRVLDNQGNAIEDHTVVADPYLRGSERLDRMAAVGGAPAVQAIPARAAYLTSKLLAQVVSRGFSTVVRQTGIPAAGKTGTSSDTMDVSFIAYTSRFITAVWVGDDERRRPLGLDDAAYLIAVPLWARFTYATSAGFPNAEIPWQVPPGVKATDRGEHSKGQRGAPSNLVYTHGVKLRDLQVDPATLPRR
ncbi:MAG: transglycosylase domain-containing protein [Myxococcales bacterium]|nr:transglycosylase domain-containing protein [Myxococcales bacterium]